MMYLNNNEARQNVTFKCTATDRNDVGRPMFDIVRMDTKSVDIKDYLQQQAHIFKDECLKSSVSRRIYEVSSKDIASLPVTNDVLDTLVSFAGDLFTVYVGSLCFVWNP